MRQARHRIIVAGALCAWAGGALAQTHAPAQGDVATPVLLPSSSSYYNQQGFNLPSVSRPSGQDIIRGAGGVSCQSAVGGNGPVLDMGVIGTQDPYGRDGAAAYGRISIPLGHKPKRVDCTRLYELEVERLQLELRMLRADTVAARATAPEPVWDAVEPAVEGVPPRAFQLGDIGTAP